MAEILDELVVKIKSDVTNLNRELSQLKSKLSKESTEMGKKLSFKARFDASIAKLRLSELQAYRQKLQKEFDKKISLNVDSASLDRTRLKIASVDQQLQGVGKSASPLSKIFGGIGASIGAAFATAGIVRLGFEAVTLAGKVQGVKTAFNNLNQPGLLDNLRAATRNTVSDFELMKLAMRASNFKIPLTELGTLLEFAEKRASQTGQEVDYLVNSIIDGIGRKSTLVLDNLGISATELQEEFAKTGDFGKATANIIEREMQKMGVVIDTSATKLAQLNAQIENQKAEIGNNLLPAWNGLLMALGGGISMLSAMGQELKRVLTPQKYYNELISEAIEKQREYSSMLENTYTSFTKLSTFIVSTYKQQKDTVGQVKTKIDELVASQDNMVYGSKEYLKTQKDIEKLEKSIGQGKEKTITTTYESKIKGLKDNPSDVKPLMIDIDKDALERMHKKYNETIDLVKLKKGELVLNMQETDQVILDNSMFTTQAIYDDWIAKNEAIKNSIDDLTQAFTSGFFEQIKISSENANSMLEQGFVAMANAFIAQVERMIAEWLAFEAIKLGFSLIAAPFTGGASLAVAAAAHSGGDFIGTENGIMKMAAGGSFIVPPGFPNDSYPLLVESGEEIRVNPASSVGSQERLLSEISRKLNRLEMLNANLVSKNFSPVIMNKLELNGRELTKQVVSTINTMEREGRQLSRF